MGGELRQESLALIKYIQAIQDYWAAGWKEGSDWIVEYSIVNYTQKKSAKEQ